MSERSDSERIAIIETVVLQMEKQLFGNGQPGQIDILHERIGDISKRVVHLENWKWWLSGMAFAVGSMLGYMLRT